MFNNRAFIGVRYATDADLMKYASIGDGYGDYNQFLNVEMLDDVKRDLLPFIVKTAELHNNASAYGPIKKDTVRNLNATFFEQLRSGDMTKLAEDMSFWLKTRLLPKTVANLILPPVPVPEGEKLIPEIDEDILYRIVFVQPDHETANIRAYTLSYRGSAPAAVSVQIPRAKIYYMKIETDEVTQNETELKVYDGIPIMTYLAEQQAYKMSQALDELFFKQMVKKILEDNPSLFIPAFREANPPSYLTKELLTRMQKALSDGMVPEGFWVMNRKTFLDVQLWDHSQIGDLVSQVVINGLVFKTLFNIPVIDTLSPLIPEGVVYLFTKPAYLGLHEILQEPKFSIAKRHDQISTKTWEQFGLLVHGEAPFIKLRFKALPGDPDSAEPADAWREWL